MRQLFVIWQFNGDNKSWCNLKCPYCYGGKKLMRHFWNGDIGRWEKAFERLNRDIYFVMSYGEAMGSHGFYECIEMIGKHPSWTLCIITNLSYSPERLIASRLGREKRVFILASWHPLGVKDHIKGWETFKKHLLMLKKAGIPTHVQYLWYKPQIKLFPEYFSWFDSNDVRISLRRYCGNINGFKIPLLHKWVGGKNYPKDYTPVERECLYASCSSPKLTEYCLRIVSPKGKLCTASKDLILVKHDGTVGLCADCPDYYLGNIFDSDFKLNSRLICCPSNVCGCCSGMLHLVDERFGSLPSRLQNDTFLSIVENIKQDSPVHYPNRVEMLKWLKKIEKSLC